jgi:hypothetical protein
MRCRKITRRAIVAGSSLGHFLTIKISKAQSSDSVTIKLRVDQEVFDAIPFGFRRGLVHQEDKSKQAQDLISSAPPERALPVILIVVGALSIPVVWNSIQEMIREYYYGGVVIDTRSTPPSIVNSKEIPANMIIVIDASGRPTKYDSMAFTQEILQNALAKKL